MLWPILLAIAIPIVISCVMLGAGWLWVRRSPERGLPWWSIAGAAALGYAGGHLSLSGWPQLPPGDVTHWLPFVAVMAFICTALLSMRGTAPFLWLVRVLLATGTSLLLCFPLLKAGISPTSAGAALTLLASQLMWFVMLDKVSRRFSGLEFLSLALFVGVGISIALVLARSAMLGQLAGAMAAAMGPIWASTIVFRKRMSVFTPLVIVLVPVLCGLLFLGSQFAYLPAVPALMIAVAAAIPAVVGYTRAGESRLLRWSGIGVSVILLITSWFLITRALPAVELYEL